MRAIEKAARAIAARQNARREEDIGVMPENFEEARAAVLAFLDGVDPLDTARAAMKLMDDNPGIYTKMHAVLSALRAQAGETE